MAAGVWLAGIPVLKAAGDLFCEKILKIPMKLDFSNGDRNIGNCTIEDTINYLVQTKENASKFSL